ncbi:class I adenylate-forming enzyme family protein [Humibacter albus]|uniref:class I adenylate-forming enzyme family protein n=1 Tax=Humibacter albus TaxID=427754 RepID=UPI0003B3DEF9|nr:AMP-binding protein [Humibacter albus]
MARERIDETDFPTIGELIVRRAAENGQRHYLEDARSDRALTYADLLAGVTDFLRAAALGEPTTVFVQIADPLAFALAHLALVAAGHRSVPMDPALGVADIRRLAGLVDGPKALVADDPERAAEAGLRPLPVPDPQREHRAEVDASSLFRDGGSAMLFTSGSTGKPKGVELTADRLAFVGSAVGRHLRLTESDRGYNPLPLFHINAEVVGLLATLNAGATLVLDRRFHRTDFWPLMAQRRITWINAVPAILAVLATEPIVPPPGLRLIRTASAPLPGPVADAFIAIPLVVSYGMTEASSQITATPVDAPRAGTVGIPVGTEVQVRDGAGVVPDGTVAELWIRGRGVVRSYFAGAAADRFDTEGWLRTGDLGSRDADGYITLAGRVDDVINRGGEKVYPLEVEEALLTDPAVREVVVVGAPDEVLGSVPVAFVIPAESIRSAEDDDALVDRLRLVAEQRLPRFKRPRTITVVDDVPRAATGKVQRVRLRAAVAEPADGTE